jgi:hypothetical protein
MEDKPINGILAELSAATIILLGVIFSLPVVIPVVFTLLVGAGSLADPIFAETLGVAAVLFFASMVFRHIVLRCIGYWRHHVH